ncbi:MAG: class I SAM-dependent methyltransferase [Candidatus Wenzhouxiangella sp. M2_3B_020]
MTSPESDQTTSALEFTGERFTPECVREIFYEHWHRYAWARGLVAGLDVLDCACGEGYGSRLLADAARSVTGVDVDETSIAHAQSRYAADGLEFIRADALDLPFDDDRFDAVVSFETLEHLAGHDDLLAGFRRVLRPGGFLLLSSPDRKTYSDDTGFVNEYHVRELYRDELEALLARHFPAWRLYGQKLMFHSAVWALDDAGRSSEHLTAEADGAVHKADTPGPAPLYFLAAAAAEPSALPGPPSLSLFDDRDESVYGHYNDEVRNHIRAGHLLAERDAEIERLKAERIPLWQRVRNLLTGRR